MKGCDIQSCEQLQRLGYLLAKIRGEAAVALERELSADQQVGTYRVSAAEFGVLTWVAAMDREQPIAELCRQMSYDGGAMTRVLDRLQRKWLIRRRRCLKDRRLVYIELTDLGQVAYPRMREISMAVQNRFLRGFSRTERRQLKVLLGRMLENAR